MSDKNPTVVFPESRKVVLEDRPMPHPEDGEMLIRTQCTLVSTGTELTILTGEYGGSSAWARYGKYPFTPGYNNVGEVIEPGPGVDKQWIGKRVASYAPHAAFVLGSPDGVRPVPDTLPSEEAAFFTIAEIVMNGVRRGNVTWGEAVAVYGLGLLGQLVVRFCQIAGARPVIGIDVAPTRIALLPTAPGIVGVNPEAEDLGPRVNELTRDHLLDVVFEVTGRPDIIPDEFTHLRRLGRLVVLSSPRGSVPFDFHDLCNSPSYTIIGAHNASHPPTSTPLTPWSKPRHAELFFDLVLTGELDVKHLITHRIPHTDAPQLYQMLLQDRSQAMGVIIHWPKA